MQPHILFAIAASVALLSQVSAHPYDGETGGTAEQKQQCTGTKVCKVTTTTACEFTEVDVQPDSVNSNRASQLIADGGHLNDGEPHFGPNCRLYIDCASFTESCSGNGQCHWDPKATPPRITVETACTCNDGFITTGPGGCETNTNIDKFKCGLPPIDCTDALPPKECNEVKCIKGSCQYVPVDGCCDDEDPCTIFDTCKDGKCIGTPLCPDDTVCCPRDHDGICCKDDGDKCTTGPVCDDETNECVYPPVICPDQDGDKCTQPVCDPETGKCKEIPIKCEDLDGDPCTEPVCREGQCFEIPRICPETDKNPCTVPTCAKFGQCIEVPKVCDRDDNNACTEGFCDPGTGDCLNLPIDCPDYGDKCVRPGCDPATGCFFEQIVRCPDGTVCSPKTGECRPLGCRRGLGGETGFHVYVPKLVYGCDTSIPQGSGGMNNPLLEAQVCAPTYSVCTAAKALSLGLTLGLCNATPWNKAYMARQSGPGSNNCVLAGNNDVWGCSNGLFTAVPQFAHFGSVPCSVLNTRMGFAGSHGYPLTSVTPSWFVGPSGINELNEIRHPAGRNGGVMCCLD